MTTIITYVLIAYGVASTIALACALESVGYWKQKATQAEKYTRHLEAQIDRKHAALTEAHAQIADDNVIIACQRKQIAGHIKDNAVLQTLERYDERAELVPGELSDAVEQWLAGEEVTG